MGENAEVTGRGTRWVTVVGLLLFLVWSNSFVAASYLLGGERGGARFDGIGLTVARFAPIVPICLFWSFVVRRRESLALLRRFPWRAPIAGALSVPAYNLALFSGQQLGVPAPVASLTTALMPLMMMLLAAVFLGERLDARKGIAFSVALVGLMLIAASRVGGAAGEGPVSALHYAALIGLVALAPLSWSVYSILSKPVAGIAAPLDWTFLTVGLGGLPLLLLLPWRGGPELARLDLPGWSALLYLSLLCTVIGYAVWSWLLGRLPASTAGFLTFLNPPLTLLSKLLLALLLPTVFIWSMHLLELLGAALALTGLALVLAPGWMASRRSPLAA